MNLAAARAAGRSTFISEVPCRRTGHTRRYVAGTHACVSCQRAWNRTVKAALRLERDLIEAQRRKDALRKGLAPIVSVTEARTRELKFYFTGKPCVHGHIAQRRTNGNGCVACSQKWDRAPSRRASKKDWRRKNAKRERVRQAAYHVANRERRCAQSAASYARNRARVLARQRAYRAANPAKVRAQWAQYRKNRKAKGAGACIRQRRP